MLLGSPVDADTSSSVNILFMTFSDFPFGIFVFVNFLGYSPFVCYQ